MDNKEKTKEELKKEGEKLMYSLISFTLTMILFGVGYYLAWIWFGWELVVVLTLVLWANNIQQTTTITNKITKVVEEATEKLIKKL